MLRFKHDTNQTLYFAFVNTFSELFSIIFEESSKALIGNDMKVQLFLGKI